MLCVGSGHWRGDAAQGQSTSPAFRSLCWAKKALQSPPGSQGSLHFDTELGPTPCSTGPAFRSPARDGMGLCAARRAPLDLVSGESLPPPHPVSSAPCSTALLLCSSPSLGMLQAVTPARTSCRKACWDAEQSLRLPRSREEGGRWDRKRRLGQRGLFQSTAVSGCIAGVTNTQSWRPVLG